VFYLDHDHILARPKRSDAAHPTGFFFGLFSPCLGFHTAPPVINPIASNAAVTHKQSFTRQRAQQIWTWLRFSDFNNHKFMTFNKRIFFFFPDLPKERNSGNLLQGNPVTPHRGAMVSRPLTNATPIAGR
jgi:hypothetical protein